MRRVALFCVAAAVSLLAWPPTIGGADPPDATGWWWKPQVTTLVPVPPPPTVPEGGLYVAGDPSGAFGLAALRIVVPEDAVLGPLTLRVASAQGAPNVRACITEINWTPEQGGPMSSAPPRDCFAAAVPGVVDTPSNTISFEVSPLVRQGVLNVVLEPAPTAVFQVAFEKPGNDAIAVSSASTPPDSSYTAPNDLSYLDSPAFTDTVSIPDYAAPTSPEGPATTAAPVAPKRPAAVARPTTVRPRLAAKAKRDPDRVVAALVLVGLAGVFMWVAEKPQRMPRLVGPMAGLAGGGHPVSRAAAPVAARGVGRFRRPRAGSPPRL